MLAHLKKGSSDNLRFETSTSRRHIYWAIVFGVAAWRDLQLSSRVSNVQATSLEQFWTRGAVKTCLPPDVCLSLLKKTTLRSMFYTQNTSVLEALMKLHCASDGPSMFPLMPKKVYEDFPGAATRLWRPGTEKKAHPLCSASTATSKRVLYIEEVPIGRNLGGGWRAAVMTWRKTMHMPRQKEPQWVLLPFWSECSDICPIQYLTRPDKITLEHSDRTPRRGKIHSDCKPKLPSLPPSQTGWHWQKVSSINTSSSNLTKLWLWTASDSLKCTVS